VDQFLTCLFVCLFQELLSRTPETHPDYTNLNRALQMIEEIAEHVNKSVKEAERLRLLENLLKKNFIGLEVFVVAQYIHTKHTHTHTQHTQHTQHTKHTHTRTKHTPY
jgi:hypothetical protein